MQRKLLQIAVAFAGLIGVSFGLAGVVFGIAFTDVFDDGTVDSSVRFYKGMLLATGVIYWSCIPGIERRGERMSLVTFILVCGAASRLMAVIGHGVATLGILVSLIAGLILVPLLWLWQRHVAEAAQRGAFT
jgi:Flp pilus assembly protein TadB